MELWIVPITRSIAYFAIPIFPVILAEKVVTSPMKQVPGNYTNFDTLLANIFSFLIHYSFTAVSKLFCTYLITAIIIS